MVYEVFESVLTVFNTIETNLGAYPVLSKSPFSQSFYDKKLS